MESHQLRYFIAVAEARNIGRAAAILKMSQPPLTRQLQVLERDLGVSLFVRTSRGVDLTPAGERLLADARNVRVLLGQAAERAQRTSRGEIGRLDIGMTGSSMFDIVPRLLTAFRKARPDVQIRLHNTQLAGQLVALRQGRVLIAFERQLTSDADIQTELVTREPILLALEANHPLARKKVVPLEALRDQSLVLMSGARSTLTNVALNLCLAHGFEPKTIEEVDDIVSGTVQVAAGGAMCLVPASMRNLQLPNVVFRPIRSRVDAFMDLNCIYLKSERSPLLAAILETVRAFRNAQ